MAFGRAGRDLLEGMRTQQEDRWLAWAAWQTGPLPGAQRDHTKVVKWRNVYAATVRDWSNRIPTTAAISVTNNIGSQFARREYLYSFPLGLEFADYLVVLEDHAQPVVATQSDVSKRIAVLRSDPGWRILTHERELTVLQRRP